MSQSTMMRDMMMTAGKTSLQKTVQVFLIGMKLMLKLSKKIEIVQKEVAVHEGEESDRSYSPAPCHDRSSEDIEDAKNFNLGENNIIVEHLNNEDDTVVGDDNGDNKHNW